MLTLDDADDSERVADWVELELSLGEPSFSKAAVTSIVRDARGSEPAESFTSDVWRHLRARRTRYLTPFFEVAGDLAIRSENVVEGRLEYDVCLLFSLYGASNATGSKPKLFERMFAEAIARHVGGPAFVFGWPVLADVQTAIAARVQQVCALLRERFAEAPAQRYKDRGVDIICWKPFLEPNEATRRSCQLVVLSQCAAGHDWRKKTTELPIGSWKQYIHWAADPMKAFAVPCVIGEDLWHDIAREVEGLIFDRVRIINHLTQGVEDTELRGALQTWHNEQIEEHRA